MPMRREVDDVLAEIYAMYQAHPVVMKLAEYMERALELEDLFCEQPNNQTDNTNPTEEMQ